MKRFRFSMLAVLLSSTLLTIHEAPAAPKHGPVISPSVIAARRYKYNPPRNWIRHYLGDDRYKIAGGIWKYVTTPNDGYVYPPSAREMLARSPDDVIGFNTSDEVIEAGYVLHPAYRVQNESFSVIQSSQARTTRTSTSGGVRSSYAPRVSNINRRPQRVLLPDRASSVLLPSGWEYVELASKVYQTPQGDVLDQNAVIRPRSRRGGYILLGIQTMPLGSDAAALLRTQEKSLLQLRSSLSKILTQSGRVSSGANNFTNDLKPQRVRIAGLRGMRINMPNMPGQIGDQIVYTDSMSIVARGNKFYQVGTRGNGGGSGARSIIASFRPR